MQANKKFEKSFKINPAEVGTSAEDDVLKYIGSKISDTSAELILEAKAFVESLNTKDMSFSVIETKIHKPIPGKEHLTYVIALDLTYGDLNG